MATLPALSTELLLKSFSYNVPQTLTSHLDFNKYMKQHAISKRLLTIVRHIIVSDDILMIYAS